MKPRQTDKTNTLHILLSYAVNEGLPPVEHAKRIRKCAKYISGVTKDKKLKNACKAIRSQKQNHLVVEAVQEAMNILIPDAGKVIHI